MGNQLWICRFLTPEWLTAFGTIGACVIALILALFSKRIEHWMDHPNLSVDAVVRRPDADRATRWQQLVPAWRPVGEAWFFRLRVKNNGDVPARDVQVFLDHVERSDASGNFSIVERFTPMNLRWAHSGKTTRDVLLPQIPVFCDFIHISDPRQKELTGENLNGVAPEAGVMCLDVEVPTSSHGHLLEPGTYHFHLILGAKNIAPLPFAVQVMYSGTWSDDKDQMFRSFGMRSL
jgi:hypothetical protein